MGMTWALLKQWIETDYLESVYGPPLPLEYSVPLILSLILLGWWNLKKILAK